jgi:uncharacterized membrane protein
MTMRLHELHPSLTHFPLALIPLSLALDLVGRLAGNRRWMRAGKRLMPLAAASGVATAAAGLVAQSAVEIPPEAHDTMTTHRNLNLGLVAMTGVLACARSKSAVPSIGYLIAGLAGVAAMNYTAYLGGRLVYRHGVGVETAGGVRPEQSPEMRWERAGELASMSAQYAGQALRSTAREMRHGEFAPALARPS